MLSKYGRMNLPTSLKMYMSKKYRLIQVINTQVCTDMAGGGNLKEPQVSLTYIKRNTGFDTSRFVESCYSKIAKTLTECGAWLNVCSESLKFSTFHMTMGRKSRAVVSLVYEFHSTYVYTLSVESGTGTQIWQILHCLSITTIHLKKRFSELPIILFNDLFMQQWTPLDLALNTFDG